MARRPWCEQCGGPLFRRACLTAFHHTGPAKTQPGRVAATSGPPATYSLNWRPVYQTAKGLPQMVARWVGYSMTPGGAIQVWPVAR